MSFIVATLRRIIRFPAEKLLVSLRSIAYLVLLFFLATSQLAVQAQSSSAPINVTISNDAVNIVMKLQFTENFTKLPSFTIHLDPSHSGNIVGPMMAAMDKLVPSATIDSLDLVARTALINANTNTSLLEEDYTIQVSGVNRNLGSSIEANMAFLDMNVSQPLTVQGFELNNVGRSYILQNLTNLRNLQVQQNILSTRYFLDNKIFLNTVVPGNGTLVFNLLDFTWVLPLVAWSHQNQPLASDSTWLLPSYAVTPYNLTVGFRLVETQYLPVYEAVYSPSIQIVAPPRAQAAGSKIVFNLPSSTEIAMPILIVGFLGTGIVTFLADRRLTRSVRTKKRKR